MTTVYILHFDKPYWKTCQHYVGYTKFPVNERLKKHKDGTGCKIAKYAMSKGIDFLLVHTEEFDTISEARRREKQLKKEGNLKRRCSVCITKLDAQSAVRE